MKVLLMSYECSPYRGSEWAVGWGRLLQAARVAETHIITSKSNFEALERARAEGLLPVNIHIHTPKADDTLKEMESRAVAFAYNYTAYHHWQKLAFQLARELHERECFDLVHQVNVCTFREPGYTWQLGIPFVWGPVGGTQNFPPRFLTMLPPREMMKESVRAAVNWFSLRCKPRVRRAAHVAAVMLAANSTNQRDYTEAFGRDIDLLLETGLHQVQEPDRSHFLVRVEQHKRNKALSPLRILWSGEMQTRKALPILLRALAMLRGEIRFTLRMLGDGPLFQSWIDEAESLELLPGDAGSSVEFLGRLPFPEAVAEMNSADLFCFTSLRDTSGNVILEALAAGVPVVCFDHQGAADMVTSQCGIKLPVTSPRRAIADWAEAIRTLAQDPVRLLALSEGATAQARRFLWDANGDRINAIYARLAEQRASCESQKETAHA